MRFRGTLILLLLLVLLCGVYWGLQYRRAQERVAIESAKELHTFKPEEVKRLSIQRIGEPASVAERNADQGWSIVAPREGIRSFPPLWDRVATQLAGLKNQRTIVAEGDLKPYGLSEPALVVVAGLAGGETIELQFGSLDPTDRFRYARSKDGRVFLVDKNSFFELDRRLEDLRHRFLVNDRESPLKYIEFVRIWTGREKSVPANPPAVGEESVRVVLQRASAEAPWTLKEPVEAPANQEAVNKLAAELQFAVGSNFVDAPEKISDYGLEPPNARITVEDFKGTGTQTFEIGDTNTKGEKGGIYVRRLGEDTVFSIDGNLLTVLPRSKDSFREGRLFSGSAKDIKRIEFSGLDERYSLARNAEGVWMLETPEAGATDALFVSSYIARLAEVSGVEFPTETPAELGMDRPDATITLHLEGKAEPSVIHLRKEIPSAGFYLATQDTGGVVRVPESAATQLIQPGGRFGTREMLRFEKTRASVLDITLEGRHFKLEKVHETWLVREPAGAALENQADVDALLSALTPMHSLGTVLGVGLSDPKLGLQAPLALVSIQLAQDSAAATEPPQVLTIGNPTEDDAQQRYATVSGREGIFLIKQDVLEAIRRGVAPLSPVQGVEMAPPAGG